MLPSCRSQLDESTMPSCDNFIHDMTLNNQFEDSENEIKIMTKILEKVSSRRLLLHFLRCKDIPYNPSHNLRWL